MGFVRLPSLLSFAAVIINSLILVSSASADHYLVTYDGRTYDAALQQTTFSYTVSGTGRSPALSHFVAGLPICDPGLRVVSTHPSTNILNTDPKTGTYGIKWDFGLGKNSTLTYSYTLAGNIPEGTVRLSVKAGTLVENHSLPGPACPGNVQPASLGDYVWLDSNANGVQESSELGIGGIKVNLLACNQSKLAGTTTSSSGKYLFPNLAPGSYRVQFELPAGYAFSPAHKGGDDGKDSDAAISLGVTPCMTLANGETNLTVDAGMFQPQQPKSASLGDFVWIDTNADGVQNSSEAGLGGVKVNLLTCDQSKLASTTTSGDGGYLFSNLAAGSYRVHFELPAGYQFSSAHKGGDDLKDSDAAMTIGVSPCTTLADGETNLTVDAGVFQPQQPKFASLGDFVWIDANADGVQNNNEAGLGGVKVNLLTCKQNLLSSTTTSSTGKYLFSNLAAGSYRVSFELPAGYSFSPAHKGGNDASDSDAAVTVGVSPCTTLASGEIDLTVDAGMFNKQRSQPASLGDFVWIDASADGVQDAAEIGLGRVRVNLLSCAGAKLASTSTSSDGRYLFSNLSAGSYAVEFELPTGYSFSSIDQGGNDSTDSDADEVSGQTACITLKSGEKNSTLDAGVYEEDPVCTTKKLKSPARFFWNGLLEQVNLLSVRNICDTPEVIAIRFLDLDGNVLDTQGSVIGAKSRRDFPLNQMLGFSPTSYGYVELRFNAVGCFDGHSFNYRPSDDPSALIPGEPDVGFTVGAALENSVRGTTYLHFNTMQPSRNANEIDWMVLNWLQVTNLDKNSTKTFVRNLFDRDGTFLHSDTISVPPLARRDFEAGHASVGHGRAGLVEIVPADQSAEYMAQIVRYGTNASNNAAPTKYPFALSVYSKKGTEGCHWGHLSRGASAENWLVLSNTSTSDAEVTVRIFDYFNAMNNSPQQFVLKGRNQSHIFANAFLPVGTGGFAEVCSVGGEVLIESDFYFYGEAGSLNAAYALPGGRNECGASYGEYNTFWGQHNWLCMSNTSDAEMDVIIRAYDLDGNVIAERLETLAPHHGISFDFNAEPFNLAPDSYGVIEIIPQSDPGELLTEIVHTVQPVQGGGVTHVSSFKAR